MYPWSLGNRYGGRLNVGPLFKSKYKGRRKKTDILRGQALALTVSKCENFDPIFH